MLGFATPRDFYQPKFNYSGMTGEGRPVTLGWIPDIKTDENGYTTVRQNMPEGVERIMIMIEGLSMDGVPGALKEVIGL